MRLSTLVVALLCFPARWSVAAEADDSILGLWGIHIDFGPEVRGELRLTRQADRWQAAIAGRTVAFQSRGDSIRFSLPAGGGAFRGAMSQGGQAVEGFWLQPPSGVRDTRDPGGTRQPFATPLTLRRTGGQWRGTVRPLDATFTLYLKLYRLANGTLVGAFRNPEAGSNGGATLFRVNREGDSLWFVVRADSSSPYQRYVSASLAKSPERIRVLWPEVGRVLELRRLTGRAAASFFPRAGRDTAYVYRQPAAVADGWTTARARDAGMDEVALTRLVQRLLRLDPAAQRAPLMHSLLVAHRGRLVLEEYFFGFDRDKVHDIRSAGKTFASVMLGAVMREGARITPETRVYELLADRGPFAAPDPRKARITLAHLMTHTSGLDCNDNDENSLGNEGTMQDQSAQPDWWKYTLDLPMAHEPGTRYAYCSANTNLMGAALKAATGHSVHELFDRTIARPLQFGRYYWNLMPTGEGYLGGGAYLRPRDLLKVGQMFLDGGVWRGRRVVDSSWVRISTSPRVEISPATTGIDSLEFGNYYGRGVDALAWHPGQIQSRGRTYRTYAATGNGGQVLIVVPELSLVVVFTGGNFGQGGIWGRWGQQIVGDELVPAIRS